MNFFQIFLCFFGVVVDYSIARPLPPFTTHYGERNAIFIGVSAFLCITAVIGACLCCRRRKKGFEEFENESGGLTITDQQQQQQPPRSEIVQQSPNTTSSLSASSSKQTPPSSPLPPATLQQINAISDGIATTKTIALQSSSSAVLPEFPIFRALSTTTSPSITQSPPPPSPLMIEKQQSSAPTLSTNEYLPIINVTTVPIQSNDNHQFFNQDYEIHSNNNNNNIYYDNSGNRQPSSPPSSSTPPPPVLSTTINIENMDDSNQINYNNKNDVQNIIENPMYIQMNLITEQQQPPPITYHEHDCKPVVVQSSPFQCPIQKTNHTKINNSIVCSSTTCSTPSPTTSSTLSSLSSPDDERGSSFNKLHNHLQNNINSISSQQSLPSPPSPSSPPPPLDNTHFIEIKPISLDDIKYKLTNPFNLTNNNNNNNINTNGENDNDLNDNAELNEIPTTIDYINDDDDDDEIDDNTNNKLNNSQTFSNCSSSFVQQTNRNFNDNLLNIEEALRVLDIAISGEEEESMGSSSSNEEDDQNDDHDHAISDSENDKDILKKMLLSNTFDLDQIPSIILNNNTIDIDDNVNDIDDNGIKNEAKSIVDDILNECQNVLCNQNTNVCNLTENDKKSINLNPVIDQPSTIQKLDNVTIHNHHQCSNDIEASQSLNNTVIHITDKTFVTPMNMMLPDGDNNKTNEKQSDDYYLPPPMILDNNNKDHVLAKTMTMTMIKDEEDLDFEENQFKLIDITSCSTPFINTIDKCKSNHFDFNVNDVRKPLFNDETFNETEEKSPQQPNNTFTIDEMSIKKVVEQPGEKEEDKQPQSQSMINKQNRIENLQNYPSIKVDKDYEITSEDLTTVTPLNTPIELNYSTDTWDTFVLNNSNNNNHNGNIDEDPKINNETITINKENSMLLPVPSTSSSSSSSIKPQQHNNNNNDGWFLHPHKSDSYQPTAAAAAASSSSTTSILNDQNPIPSTSKSFLQNETTFNLYNNNNTYDKNDYENYEYDDDDGDDDDVDNDNYYNRQNYNDGDGDDYDEQDEINRNLAYDALRKQLEIALPHAQGNQQQQQQQATTGQTDFSDGDDDDDDEDNKNINRTLNNESTTSSAGAASIMENFINKNVQLTQNELFINYKRTLSPIMEESEDETCKTFILNETKCLDSTSTGCIESAEAAIMGVTKTLMASNDTLFNFEDTLGDRDDVFLSPRILSASATTNTLSMLPDCKTPTNDDCNDNNDDSFDDDVFGNVMAITNTTTTTTSNYFNGKNYNKKNILIHHNDNDNDNNENDDIIINEYELKNTKKLIKPLDFIINNQLLDDSSLQSPDQQKTFSEDDGTLTTTTTTTTTNEQELSSNELSGAIDTTFTTNTLEEKTCISVKGSNNPDPLKQSKNDDERISEISEPPEWDFSGGSCNQNNQNNQNNHNLNKNNNKNDMNNSLADVPSLELLSLNSSDNILDIPRDKDDDDEYDDDDDSSSKIKMNGDDDEKNNLSNSKSESIEQQNQKETKINDDDEDETKESNNDNLNFNNNNNDNDNNNNNGKKAIENFLNNEIHYSSNQQQTQTNSKIKTHTPSMKESIHDDNIKENENPNIKRHNNNNTTNSTINQQNDTFTKNFLDDTNVDGIGDDTNTNTNNKVNKENIIINNNNNNTTNVDDDDDIFAEPDIVVVNCNERFRPDVTTKYRHHLVHEHPTSIMMMNNCLTGNEIESPNDHHHQFCLVMSTSTDELLNNLSGEEDPWVNHHHMNMNITPTTNQLQTNDIRYNGPSTELMSTSFTTNEWDSDVEDDSQSSEEFMYVKGTPAPALIPTSLLIPTPSLPTNDFDCSSSEFITEQQSKHSCDDDDDDDENDMNTNKKRIESAFILNDSVVNDDDEEENIKNIWNVHDDKIQIAKVENVDNFIKSVNVNEANEIDDDGDDGDGDDDTNSGSSSSNCSEEGDIEEGEWVPSCWDSMAQPSRSALKSPDKKSSSDEESIGKTKKRRSVAFKKQNYHSVYEYPCEIPLSIVSPSFKDGKLWPNNNNTNHPHNNNKCWTNNNQCEFNAGGGVGEDDDGLCQQNINENDGDELMMMMGIHQSSSKQPAADNRHRFTYHTEYNHLGNGFGISSSSRPFQHLSGGGGGGSCGSNINNRMMMGGGGGGGGAGHINSSGTQFSSQCHTWPTNDSDFSWSQIQDNEKYDHHSSYSEYPMEWTKNFDNFLLNSNNNNNNSNNCNINDDNTKNDIDSTSVRSDSGVGESADNLLSDSISLGDLCHTKASLRLPLNVIKISNDERLMNTTNTSTNKIPINTDQDEDGDEDEDDEDEEENDHNDNDDDNEENNAINNYINNENDYNVKEKNTKIDYKINDKDDNDNENDDDKQQPYSTASSLLLLPSCTGSMDSLSSSSGSDRQISNFKTFGLIKQSELELESELMNKQNKSGLIGKTLPIISSPIKNNQQIVKSLIFIENENIKLNDDLITIKEKDFPITKTIVPSIELSSLSSSSSSSNENNNEVISMVSKQDQQQQQQPPITNIVTIKITNDDKLIKQNDSTDEDSGIESLMRIVKEDDEQQIK